MSEAILANFVDYRTVKTRSSFQLIFEVPIEQADEALRLLGGTPQPAETRWVGIALSKTERKAVEPKPEKERRPFDTLPLSQQAGIRCNDSQFAGFIAEHWYGDEIKPFNNVDPTALVYVLCEITSRSELDTNDLAAQMWKKLEADYQAYLTDIRYSGQIK